MRGLKSVPETLRLLEMTNSTDTCTLHAVVAPTVRSAVTTELSPSTETTML